MKLLIASLLLVFSLFLVSCIDGEEEIFLNADGSGSVKVVYRVPAVLLSEEDGNALVESIRSGVVGNPYLKIMTNEVVRDEGYQVVTIEVRADDVIALRKYQPEEDDVKTNGLLETIIGDMSFKLQGLSAKIVRDVDLAPLLSEKFGDSGLGALGDSEFRYTLHLYQPAGENNAHVVSNDGKTLHWAYKLADTETVPISLNVVAAIPIPWWAYLCCAITIIVIGLVVYRLLKKNHQKKRAA